MWRRVRQIIWKEMVQALRDPRLRIFIILPPIVQLLAYGYAINFDFQHLPLAVYDESRSFQSRQFLDRFTQNQAFSWQYLITGVARAAAAHRRTG